MAHVPDEGQLSVTVQKARRRNDVERRAGLRAGEQGRARRRAFVDRLLPKSVVRKLVDVLGAPFVAVIGHADNTATVRRWMDGKEHPEEIARLRVALEVVLYLQTVEYDDAINAWFRGMNHILGDANPGLVIADESLELARNAVMGAASAFLAQ